MAFKYKLGDYVTTRAGVEGFICSRSWDGATTSYSYTIRTDNASVECPEIDCRLVKHRPVEVK